jgi:hypothetical protein
MGLDHYVPNNPNTFIKNLTKLYNITCAYFSIQDCIFQMKTLLFFDKTFNLENKYFQPSITKTKTFNLQEQ